MIFEICSIIGIIIFAILAFFVVRTLCALQLFLKDSHHLINDVTHKMKLMDSTFKTISNLGDISEVKLNNLREYQTKYKEFVKNDNNYTDDLADLVVTALKIGTKFFRR